MAVTTLHIDDKTYTFHSSEFPYKKELDEDKKEFKCLIKVTHVEKNLKPITVLREYGSKYSEEDFHKDIRTEASKKEHLITSHSTNPEWNPENYKKIWPQ